MLSVSLCTKVTLADILVGRKSINSSWKWNEGFIGNIVCGMTSVATSFVNQSRYKH